MILLPLPWNGYTLAWLRWPRKMAVLSPVGDVQAKYIDTHIKCRVCPAWSTLSMNQSMRKQCFLTRRNLVPRGCNPCGQHQGCPFRWTRVRTLSGPDWPKRHWLWQRVQLKWTVAKVNSTGRVTRLARTTLLHINGPQLTLGMQLKQSHF